MNSRLYRSPQGLIFLLHRGSSMRPTLVDSDLLEIHPYNGRSIDSGDIIAFQNDVGEDYVVHRVMKVDDNWICTRGDNNTLMDPWVIKPSSVLGRVQTAWRGQKRVRIIEGRAGLIWSQCLQRVRKLDRRITPWFHPIYRFLSKHGYFTGLVPKRYRPQIQRFQSKCGTGYKLIVRNCVVGWYDETFEVWRVKRPYRLFVGEERLVGIREWETRSR
jgi:signal peptidase I